MRKDARNAMNTTKWKEIFRLFYDTYECGQGKTICWRTCTTNGFQSGWDTTWSHFLAAGDSGRDIVSLQIRPPQELLAQVRKDLRALHLPGEEKDGVITIWGYRQDVDWL